MKDTRLGDTMPNRKAVKWGDMTTEKSILSDEWHAMEHSTEKMSNKWDEQSPSAPRMSEKWADQQAGSTEFSDRWHEMKQEGRIDPYSMAPSEGDRTVGMKKMAKETPDNKVTRFTQHTEFGSTREI